MEMLPSLYNSDPVSGSLTVFIEGKQFVVHATDSNFQLAVKAYSEKDWETLHTLVNPSIAFMKLYAKYEQIEVKNGNVYVNDESISNVIATRILDYLSQGIDCLPVFKFITKLNLNPSSRAVNELYTFLEHKFLPITNNGNFLAYKALRSNYTDIHTGKFDNNVDNVLEMPRNKVDDNKDVGCSYGFHAGTLDYARNFRPHDGKLVLVEINPADVVSIPTDCECQKLRTCKYKVVAEYEVPLEDLTYQSRFTTDDDEDVDREWDDEECTDDNTYCDYCAEIVSPVCEGCQCCNDCCNCSKENEWSDCGNCNCGDCVCCKDSCDCEQDSDTGGCMADPDAPKTEIQLQLNLDNKMQEDDWKARRFNYEKMLNFLYSNRRPAVANAMRDFYKSVSHHHLINPEFTVLLQFTSDEDVYKIYQGYNS
jgi:hypothetical protein